MACEDSDRTHDRSFLLIVRTSRIFTAHRSSEGFTEFPAISQIYFGLGCRISTYNRLASNDVGEQQLNLELFHNVLNPARVPL